MQVEINLVAKKYAQAFLNVFSCQVSKDNLDKWIALEKFLEQNKLFYIYLGIPSISYFTKQRVLTSIAHELKLEKPIIKMMFLLLDHRRIEFLHAVLNKIILLYRRKNNIKKFVVTYSHDLNEEEKQEIIKFTENISGGEVVAEFVRDEKLICGLRIQSLTFLWERSVAKQLRGVKRSIFKQVGIW